MTIAFFLACVLALDETTLWIDAVDTYDARKTQRQTELHIATETTNSRLFPAGRVEGARAFVYWSEQLVEEPTLTCIDLRTRSLVWQVPLSEHVERLLFTHDHIIACETPGPHQRERQLRWFRRDTGALNTDLTSNDWRWYQLFDQKWLVFSTGEIRDAETGQLLATTTGKYLESALVFGTTLIALVDETSQNDEHEQWVQQTDLKTGTILARHSLREIFERESVVLIAANDRMVVFDARSFDGTQRALLCLDTASGLTRWRTPVPLNAPIRFLPASTGMATVRSPRSDLASAASLDIDFETGMVLYPRDRSSPLSRFDWYGGSGSTLLSMRLVNDQLVGWFKFPGSHAPVLSVDAHTGKLRWSTPVTQSVDRISWMPELSPSTEFVVIPVEEGLLEFVNLETGKLSILTVNSLGLPPRLKHSLSPPVNSNASIPSREPKSESLKRRVVLSIAALVVVVLMYGTFRSTRGRNSRQPSTPPLSPDEA